MRVSNSLPCDLCGADADRCWHQKSQADAGLGAFPATNVTVRQSYLSSECCNAIMFGSRTEVDMSDFTFEDLILGSVRTSTPSLSLGPRMEPEVEWC